MLSYFNPKEPSAATSPGSEFPAAGSILRWPPSPTTRVYMSYITPARSLQMKSSTLVVKQPTRNTHTQQILWGCKPQGRRRAPACRKPGHFSGSTAPRDREPFLTLTSLPLCRSPAHALTSPLETDSEDSCSPPRPHDRHAFKARHGVTARPPKQGYRW